MFLAMETPLRKGMTLKGNSFQETAVVILNSAFVCLFVCFKWHLAYVQ